MHVNCNIFNCSNAGNRAVAGRGGPGVRTPPSTARPTHTIRLNPMSFSRGGGGHSFGSTLLHCIWLGGSAICESICNGE